MLTALSRIIGVAHPSNAVALTPDDVFPRNRLFLLLSAVAVAEPAEIPDIAGPELIQRAQRGDEEAFGVLMRGHYEHIFRVVCGIVRDEHTARDICQEVWVTVWRNLAKFRGDSKFSTWVHPIAVRRSIDYLRSRKRWSQRFLPFLTGEDDGTSDRPAVRTPEPAAESDPRNEAERAEQNQRFERALESLPPKHRAVLALREINGLSYDEIAHALSIRRGTVMSRLFNARRMLVQKLGAQT
jgi:RNA polymerase sigma-70 factor, ECF subfamily